MDAKVIWHQGLSFTGSAGTAFQVPLGADLDVGGADDGFRPLELMAVSLAGCTGMDVASILRKKKQEVTAFEVRVHADQAAEHPMVFTRCVVLYQVIGRGLDEAAVRRAIELSATKYCPAQAMLGRIIPLELKYEIYEAEEGGTRHLVKEDRLVPNAA
jgi:putative redox protein